MSETTPNTPSPEFSPHPAIDTPAPGVVSPQTQTVASQYSPGVPLDPSTRSYLSQATSTVDGTEAPADPNMLRMEIAELKSRVDALEARGSGSGNILDDMTKLKSDFDSIVGTYFRGHSF